MPTFASGDPFRGREDAIVRLRRLFEEEAAARAGTEESNRLATRSEVSRSSGLSPEDLDASQLARFQARKLPGPVVQTPEFNIREEVTPQGAAGSSPQFGGFRPTVGTSEVSAEAEQERALQPLRDIGLERGKAFSEAITIPELNVPRRSESISDVTSTIDQTNVQGLTPEAVRSSVIGDIGGRGAASLFALGEPEPGALEALQRFAVGTGEQAAGGGEAVGLGPSDPGFIQEILSRAQGGESLVDILSELDFEELEATYAGLTEAGVSQAVISGLRNAFATQ